MITKSPFKINQPEIPFEVTNKAARLLTNRDVFVQMIYANDKQGVQLIFAQSKSKVKSKMLGKKGPKLQNGAQSWIADTGELSGGELHWKKDGFTYALLSIKIQEGNFVPHYNANELVEIANTIK